MSNINWSSIGSTLSTVAMTLSSLNITGSTAQSILGAVGLASNPNESAELQVCQSIMLGMANPTLVSALVMKLVTEQGIPQDAAELAMTASQPGADIPKIMLEVETLIKQGG
jgi:hypothetical protein